MSVPTPHFDDPATLSKTARLLGRHRTWAVCRNACWLLLMLTFQAPMAEAQLIVQPLVLTEKGFQQAVNTLELPPRWGEHDAVYLPPRHWVPTDATRAAAPAALVQLGRQAGLMQADPRVTYLVVIPTANDKSKQHAARRGQHENVLVTDSDNITSAVKELANSEDLASRVQPAIHFCTQQQAATLLCDETWERYLRDANDNMLRFSFGLKAEAEVPEQPDQRLEFAQKMHHSVASEFDETEQQILTDTVNALQAQIGEAWPLVARLPWNFICVQDNFCHAFPHTRGLSIVLTRRTVRALSAAPKRAMGLLLHEKLHILQRIMPHALKELFQDYGYQPFQLSAESRQQLNIAQNPDAFSTTWGFKLEDQLHFLVPQFAVHKGHFVFEEHLYQLQPEPDGTYRTAEPVDSLHASPFMQRFHIRTGYDHPHEVMAYISSILLYQDFLKEPPEVPAPAQASVALTRQHFAAQFKDWAAPADDAQAVSAAPPQNKQPNILFLAIDDQNDWIGCMGGHPQAQTPHIDALAKRGTLFTNAHCQSPLCNSSRTSLMTGLRPSTTGIYGLAPWFRNLPEFQDTVTLPQYLARHGYRTYSAGKIYHGGYGRRAKDQEFHELGPSAGVRVWPPEGKLVDTPSPNKLVDWGVFPHRDQDKGDWLVADWTVRQLDELKDTDKPFFLSCGFFLPHVPCYATPRWFELYPLETLQLPPYLATDRDDTPRFSWYLHWQLPEPRTDFLQQAGQWKNLVRSYLACTSFVDSQVGRIMDALEASGLADNTIIVLWSDHGWHLGEKRITGKNTLWERSTRVPLMFAGPGVAVGAKCEQPAELLDIYPTLLDLCQLPAHAPLEGLSLVPQLRQATAGRERPAITTHNQHNHGVRSRNWRYIQYADGSEELYDLRTDPHEWKNLADQQEHANVIASHRRWIPSVNRPPAAGSRHRILIRDADTGAVQWEGKPIPAGAAVPEINVSP